MADTNELKLLVGFAQNYIAGRRAGFTETANDSRDAERLIERLANYKAATPPADAALDDARAQKPVAYMHNKRADVIHTSVKSLLSDFAVNSGPESMLRPIDKSEHYTIPLYAAPVPAQPSDGDPIGYIGTDGVIRRTPPSGWKPLPLRTPAPVPAQPAAEQEAVAKDALEDLADTVSKALGRAWSLGQTYWIQADSESYSQNRKSIETQSKFHELVEATRAAILSAADTEVKK